MDNLGFIKTAIKDYKVGAITKTSSFVVKRILDCIKPEYKYFVEYGPGDGVLTKEILRIMPKDGKLVGIERNADFFSELRNIKDKRFLAVHGDIVDVTENLKSLRLPRIDFVVSNVPFTIMSGRIREKIVENTCGAMSPGGTFVVFQYSLLLKPIIKKVFNNFSSCIEIRNLPPYFIMTAEKKD